MQTTSIHEVNAETRAEVMKDGVKIGRLGAHGRVIPSMRFYCCPDMAEAIAAAINGTSAAADQGRAA